MTLQTASPLPKITLREPVTTPLYEGLEEVAPSSTVAALLRLTSLDLRQTGILALVCALIEEGRRYATTAEGRRWAGVLESSPAVVNGWLLWNRCNADFHLRNVQPLADSPGALLETALRELAANDLTDLVTLLSRFNAEVDGRLRPEEVES